MNGFLLHEIDEGLRKLAQPFVFNGVSFCAVCLSSEADSCTADGFGLAFSYLHVK